MPARFTGLMIVQMGQVFAQTSSRTAGGDHPVWDEESRVHNLLLAMYF
jgi:hypothetical protein